MEESLATPQGGAQGKGDNRPEQDFLPGELAPHWASPYPDADLSEQEKNTLHGLVILVGQKDTAARRWEVESSWESRLFDRGYQYLLPKRGGGWILPPFAANYGNSSSGSSGGKFYGYETNIYTTYGEIITAALTRDIPRVRFEPQNPESDSDILAAQAASQYAKIFARNNDLLEFQHQLVYYLRNDGRALVVVDFVKDAGRFGREEPEDSESLVPEVPKHEQQALIYLARHGETPLNAADKPRGRSEVPLDIRGEKEAKEQADFFKDKGVKLLLSSPVHRAYQTAETIGKGIGLQPEADDRFASLNLGTETDCSKETIASHFKTGQAFAGGESPPDFENRVRDGLFAILQAGTFPVALVTHDSVITAITKILEGSEDVPSGEVGPGSVLSIEINPDGTYQVNQVHPFQRMQLLDPRHRPAPRGAEVVSCYGKLEGKVPINAQTIKDFPFVQVSREYDIAYVKAMFPDKADKIMPGGSSSGENELDRIARINACLGLEASYVTGDSMVRDCTVSRIWFRPAFFMEIADKDIRASIMAKFPDGVHVVMAGNVLVSARNESMDDHVTLVQAFPGSGQNRISLLSKVLSIQKRLNNWVDLLNDYFIRTVPNRYINSDIFNVEAITTQANRPGPFIPFSLRNTPTVQTQGQMVFVEPTPQPQPSMPEFIQLFINQIPQLLSGALPSVFGAQSNADSGVGMAIQRDAALGRLGTPWHAIQVATCSYFRQAVQLAAWCRAEDISAFDTQGTAVHVALTDLKGNVQAYPEQDANFPESWNQKQTRYQNLITEAANNPTAASLLASPGNLKLAKDMSGLCDLIVPGADSYEKQQGELEALVGSAPLPNPAYEQAMQLAQQHAAAAVGAASVGAQQAEGMALQAEQAQQQAQQLPPQISSVPIDPDTDNHVIEAQACLDFINCAHGRKLRYGTSQERLAFENVKLHYMEHKAQIAPPPAQMKPPSFSVNFKDMPPAAASELLQKEGLQTDPGQIANDRAMHEAVKKLGKEPPAKEKK